MRLFFPFLFGIVFTVISSEIARQYTPLKEEFLERRLLPRFLSDAYKVRPSGFIVSKNTCRLKRDTSKYARDEIEWWFTCQLEPDLDSPAILFTYAITKKGVIMFMERTEIQNDNSLQSE